MNDSMMMATVIKFFNLFGELTILFIGISMLVYFIQQKLSPEKIQEILGGKKGRGYIVAALLGAVTPFCTCSTVPMIKGMIKAKVGFGAILTFLLTSPLLNPIIIFLFVRMIGLEITILYMAIALIFSIGASILLEKLNFERYVISTATLSPLTNAQSGKDFVIPQDSTGSTFSLKTESAKCCDSTNSVPENTGCSSQCGSPSDSKNLSLKEQFKNSFKASFKDFKEVLIYLIISCLVGAVVYGYVPSELLALYIGADNPYAIPVAAVIGIPLYIRASVLIPLASVLISKGVGIGSMMALIIGGAGASLPELILLKSMFKMPLILAFIAVVLSMAVFAGYTVQFLF